MKIEYIKGIVFKLKKCFNLIYEWDSGTSSEWRNDIIRDFFLDSAKKNVLFGITLDYIWIMDIFFVRILNRKKFNIKNY